MAGRAHQVWDGKRAKLPRAVVTRTQTRIGQLGIISATENLSHATDWSFEEDHHTVVVHLGGRLDRMDCEFSAGPSGSALPARGDIWIIPAGCRYAALAQGERAQFVEFNVPTKLLDDRPLMARVQHRDAFFFAAAERLSELVIADSRDDLARMASHAIVEALQFHLLHSYGAGRRIKRKRYLDSADRALLVDAVRSQLDARISLETLAALVGMEVRSFSSAFKDTFGLPPWQYVLHERLNEAVRLLRDTNSAVTEIAFAVGFATPSHFATSFTQRFGVSPMLYRRSIR